MCELVATGLDSKIIVLFAGVILCTSIVLYVWAKKYSIHYRYLTVVLILVASTLGMFMQAQTTFAQSANDCASAQAGGEGSGHADDDDGNSDATPDNQVLAHDDGPYLAGVSWDNMVLIPVINNDLPGNSEFDYSTLDLDPSTPAVDSEFYYDDGTYTGIFRHHMSSGIVIFQPQNVLAGATISTPYIIATNDGDIAGPADIIVTITDWIAQGDVVAHCNFPPGDVMSLSVLDNDSHASGINGNTLDLNPNMPGVQAQFTSSNGVVYEIASPGVVDIRTPLSWDTVTGIDQIFYTVQATDGTMSNFAPIVVQHGTCG